MSSMYYTIYYLPTFSFDTEGIMHCMCPEDNFNKESMNPLDLDPFVCTSTTMWRQIYGGIVLLVEKVACLNDVQPSPNNIDKK